MPKHRVKAKGRTEEGKVVDMRFPTIAPMVECAVKNESGETYVMPLDEVLANHADEINQNTAQMVTIAQTSDELQQTLEVVNGKVGLENDTSAKATLFGRIKQVYEHLTTNLSTARANKIENLDGTISSRATQASVNTLQSTANSIGADLGAVNTNVSNRATQTSVNTLQTTANTINTNVGTANTNIGASGNTASASGTTLFALIKYVVSTIGTVATNITAIKTNTDKLASGTAIARTVKSVQRGVIVWSKKEYVITISSIDTSRAEVKLNGVTCNMQSFGNLGMPYVVSLTSTVLTIGTLTSSTDCSTSWEVVENY